VEAAAVAATSATLAASLATLVAALMAFEAKLFNAPNPKGIVCASHSCYGRNKKLGNSVWATSIGSAIFNKKTDRDFSKVFLSFKGTWSRGSSFWPSCWGESTTDFLLFFSCPRQF
jgi:hypothetical protein